MKINAVSVAFKNEIAAARWWGSQSSYEVPLMKELAVRRFISSTLCAIPQ